MNCFILYFSRNGCYEWLYFYPKVISGWYSSPKSFADGYAVSEDGWFNGSYSADYNDDSDVIKRAIKYNGSLISVNSNSLVGVRV